ncbi:hypothetical protein QYE76_004384 [Lolium multiflorum]|uniref:CCHC-type domain-containing protein n=1 Tax=Lolium multiflorum TaxID=4521 RepID=A0AAD8RRX6_LOLMU|nr:hypothetical protein QYE76_004384 [Lolium multiflorum]
MDACTGVDQAGKRYWQRIEDLYHQLKPRTKSMADRSYRSLEGRWNTIKPACSRWSAAMDQVADNPPSGCVLDDYYAQLRYKDMAGSKNKEFQFQHCFSLLQHLPKWKLRDNEPKCKKEALLNMDDEAEDMSARNKGKPEGSKKAKERVKVEGEAASFKEKLDQLMKSKEALTMKTLETKLLITEKKKEVKLAKVEARREDAKVKAELESRMLVLKEAKAMKELLAEEREIMMMRTEDMDKDQLAWWKETKADIMVRKMLARQARAACVLGVLTPQAGYSSCSPITATKLKNFVMNYNMQNMNKELPELFSMLKSAEIEIQKEHQVLMVNKTTKFKKQGKPKKDLKKGGKKAAAPPEKPKGGPKPDIDCYYCNGKGHWKRNCPKYLADLKSGLVKKKKGISDIHVIDVYLTGSRTSAWVFDTGSVAHICNSKQELRNKRSLARMK